MEKKLAKSIDKRISGVCGGIAQYFDIDPTIIRACWAVLTVASGFPGIVLYIILALVMPKEETPAVISETI